MNGDVGSCDDVWGEDVDGGSDSQSELLGQPVVNCCLAWGENFCPGNVEAGIVEVCSINSDQRKECPGVGGSKPDQSYCGLLNFRGTLDIAQIMALENRRKSAITDDDVSAAPELVDVIGKLARCACGC